MPSVVIVGETGSGKSEFAKVKAKWLRDSDSTFQFTADGKGTTVDEIFAQDVADGYEQRVIYHALASPIVLGLDLLKWSEASGYVKEIEDDLIKQNFKDIFIASQGDRSDKDQPWKKDWFDAALDLHRYQSSPKPVYYIYYAFLFDSDEHKRMVRDCTHEPTRDKFATMAETRRKSRAQAENELGGARRRVAPLVNSLIMAHVMAKTKLNLEEAIVQKKHILLNGAGIGKETFRVFVLMFILLIVSTVKAYNLRTGRKAPAVIRLEEAGAYQLIAPFVIEYMQTLRYLSVFFEPMSQSFTDFGEDLPRLMQNAPEKRIFGVGWLDDMEMASKFISMAGFDPKRLHYQTYQQFADGVEERKTKTASHNAGESERTVDGVLKKTKMKGGGTTEGSTFRNGTQITSRFARKMV